MPMVEYITDDGKEMLAQMLAGKITITFTKIQMGDGTLEIGQSRRTMTHLVNLIKELEVYRVEVTEENVVSIMGIFDNSDMTSGFWFREKGVFASDGINEVLFAYANAGDSAEYINPPTVESVEKQIISLYTNLQSTEKEVNINVFSGIYALNEDVEKHTFNTENPHGVTKSQVGLGNVPNVATNDQTPTYTVSTSNAELTSGEKLSVAFGKIAKAVSTLISHIATSATSSVLGHVKLSDSSAVTDSTGLALPATEKNASIEGTLANQISALSTDLNSHNHDNRYYTESEINTKFSSLLKTYIFSLPSITINANSSYVNSSGVNLSSGLPTGYTPIGICGYSTKNGNILPAKLELSGTNFWYSFKNVSSSSITTTPEIFVLCYKTTF